MLGYEGKDYYPVKIGDDTATVKGQTFYKITKNSDGSINYGGNKYNPPNNFYYGVQFQSSDYYSSSAVIDGFDLSKINPNGICVITPSTAGWDFNGVSLTSINALLLEGYGTGGGIQIAGSMYNLSIQINLNVPSLTITVTPSNGNSYNIKATCTFY